MDNFVEIKNLSVAIQRKRILKNVSFSLTKGGIWGLIGPNGAGKTTVMKALIGLLTNANGTIKINGQTVSSNSHAAVRKYVGALIEYPAIYPFLTGLQHLMLSSKDEADIDSIVNTLGMSDYINKKAKAYSLGMKQKLGIAIALVNHPQFVILDEPMNGLDPEATLQLRTLIKKKQQEGITFLISSHIISELQKIIDGVVVINEGQIVLESRIDELNDNAHQSTLIKTANDGKARQMLRDKFNIKNDDPLLVSKSNATNLNDYLELIIENKIPIESVTPNHEYLETLLLNLLNYKNEGKD